jgi:hypothetical protein
MIWYVNSSSGNDSDDGRSAATPFKTFSRALNAAKPGDTILIAPGAYPQDLASEVGAARSANIVVAVLGAE